VTSLLFNLRQNVTCHKNTSVTHKLAQKMSFHLTISSTIYYSLVFNLLTWTRTLNHQPEQSLASAALFLRVLMFGIACHHIFIV